MLWRAAGRGESRGGPGPWRSPDYGEDKRNPKGLNGFSQQAAPYTGLLHAATTS